MTRRVTTDVVAGLLLIACACTSSGGTGSSGGISGGRTHSLAGSALLETDGYSLLCGGAACSVPEGGVPASLQRALHLPTLRPGQACPVSAARRVSRDFGPAIGTGPVFAAGLIGEGPFPFEYPPSKESIFYGSPWGGNKVLWLAKPTYAGPVLIRGGSLDGSHSLGFSIGDGSAAYANLQFPPQNPGYSPENPGYSGWRSWPSATRLQASGCYAYQVDGINFSEVIVFEAVAIPS